MDVTPIIPAERQVIQAYGDGRFRISGVVHEGSVIVLPERTLAWPAAAMAGLTLESLKDVLAAEPRVELLLVGRGRGREPAPIAAELRAALRPRGIVVEVMDTGAACRTYNVLLAEGRRVAAALIAVA
jgi:uncharacterized protein